MTHEVEAMLIATQGARQDMAANTKMKMLKAIVNIAMTRIGARKKRARAKIRGVAAALAIAAQAVSAEIRRNQETADAMFAANGAKRARAWRLNAAWKELKEAMFRRGVPRSMRD
jgi:CO/xanthine dehydrogenase FAD-binding subunit